jgi:hypothetical protein
VLGGEEWIGFPLTGEAYQPDASGARASSSAGVRMSL